MTAKPKLTLSDYRDIAPGDPSPFRIIRAEGTTEYAVGSWLDLRSVNQLIDRGWTVILTVANGGK